MSRGGALISVFLLCVVDLSIGSFNKTVSADSAPVNFSGQKNLFSDGSGSVDIDANLQASVGISAVAAGTILPPKLTQFEITFGMLYRIYQARTMIDRVHDFYVGVDGNADAKISVSGDISGKVSSGDITLFQTGFPGFSIPKYVGAGPRPMDSNSRMIVESLMSVPNLRYRAGLMPLSDLKM